MITDEQIQQLVNQIESLKLEIDLLKDNVFYIEWKKLEPVIAKGQQMDKVLASKAEHVKYFESEASKLIEQQKLERQAPAPPTVQQPVYNPPGALVPPQQAPVAPVQQQMPTQPPDVPTVQQQQMQQAVQEPVAQPVHQPTFEEEAEKVFPVGEGDIGTDEEPTIEGLPDFEPLEPVKPK